jgi:inhibitor of KinA sporulation pathway (predicted exonuclease)
MPGYVVVDLEATCWERAAPHPNEIIEIGAVLLRPEAAGPDERAFQSFVRPQLAPELSPFCTALTTIEQGDVDAAPPFAEAFAAFLGWIQEVTREPASDATLASWGRYDWRQLEADRAAVPFPFTRHLNVRRAYAAVARRRRGRPESLAEAMVHLALPPEGTPHRALDDARNAARVLACLLAAAPADVVVAAGSPA